MLASRTEQDSRRARGLKSPCLTGAFSANQRKQSDASSGLPPSRLVVVLDDLRPRLQTVGREPEHREHQVVVRYEVLQPGAPITQWPSGQVAAVVVQQVERHEERRRGDGSGVGVAQSQSRRRTELLV
jgi:hypothetical protein